MHEKTWHSVASTFVSAPSHTWNIFNVDQFRRVVECFEAKLERINKATPFNAIAGCGNSGVPLAAALSYLMGIPMITVRKPGEETAAGMASRVTGAFNAGAYVIIDDFWSSGGTVNRMMDAIDCASDGKSKPVALAYYDYRTDSPEGTESRRWWSKDVLVPMWGVSNSESEFINLGTKMRVDDAQEDLFDWARRKRLRDEREATLKLESEREAAYELERAKIQKLYANELNVDVFIKRVNIVKYKPPPFVVGNVYERTPKNVPLPRNTR